MAEKMCKIMKNDFFQLGTEWVIVNGVPLRFLTRHMHPILKALSPFLVQPLESASNQSDFIVKRCMVIISILNHEPIHVGRLIAKNIKYMDDTPQRDYGIFLIVNELCRLAGVQSHPDDGVIILMLPINQSSMRRISIHHVHGGGQEEAHGEGKNQEYNPEIQ